MRKQISETQEPVGAMGSWQFQDDDDGFWDLTGGVFVVGRIVCMYG